MDDDDDDASNARVVEPSPRASGGCERVLSVGVGISSSSSLIYRCVSKQSSSTRVPRLTSIPGVPEQSSTTSLLLLLLLRRPGVVLIRQRCRPAEEILRLIRRRIRSAKHLFFFFLSCPRLPFSLSRLSLASFFATWTDRAQKKSGVGRLRYSLVQRNKRACSACFV